jgi:hypothetical protein
MTRPGSFGAPNPVPRDDPEVPATPVLYVGEVHADLRLRLTEETLTELGSQIASLIAQATKQGFEHGLNAAMSEPDGT